MRVPIRSPRLRQSLPNSFLSPGLRMDDDLGDSVGDGPRCGTAGLAQIVAEGTEWERRSRLSVRNLPERGHTDPTVTRNLIYQVTRK